MKTDNKTVEQQSVNVGYLCELTFWFGIGIVVLLTLNRIFT